MLEFVDSHCHLDRLQLESDETIGQHIRNTQSFGVKHMLNVCIDFNNWHDVINIAENNHNVYASVGIHPSDASDAELTVDDLAIKTTHDKVVAIGETGLDYHYSKDNKANQSRYFRTHIQAAIKAELPLIIHTREARYDTIKTMQEENAKKCGGVMHCFTESWQMAKQALDLGFYISFSGIITFKNAGDLREVAKKTPLDKILIETDSPYLAPEPHRGKPNKPLYVKHVAEKLAEIRNISIEKVAETTRENFFALFTRVKANKQRQSDLLQNT